MDSVMAIIKAIVAISFPYGTLPTTKPATTAMLTIKSEAG